MFHGHLIVVVIPAFNEADKIVGTIRSVPGFVDHVLVVDDGSRDATAAVAGRAARRASGRGGARQVEVIVHARNRGVGAAIATGYARALALGADATAVMAGDGQMDPADLPRLLAPIVDGAADYAKGNRFAWPGGWRQMPAVRLGGSVVLSWLTRAASGYWRLFDSQCGYTVASRRALEAIGQTRMFARYGYPNDLLARLGAVGARVVDVPVRPVYGPAWRSGLRPSRVVLPLAWLLLRAFVSRVFISRFFVRRALGRGLRARSVARLVPIEAEEAPCTSAS
jgi:glycosyltransferase involved in cell wall biosynthesis